MIEYALVVLASVATATVILVVDRVDHQGAAPARSVTAGPQVTTSVEPGPSSSTTPAATPTRLPSTTTTRRTATTSPPVPPGLAGQDVERLPTTREVVALTFDAGANADGVASILDTPRRAGVPATFFLTGDFATRFAGPSATIAAAGHRLGNHSVSHPHFPALSEQAIRAELAGAEQSIRASTGRDARPLFRFPFGDRDQHTIRAVNDTGYVAVRWTVDTLGWKGTSGGMTASSVTTRVLTALRPGRSC